MKKQTKKIIIILPLLAAMNFLEAQAAKFPIRPDHVMLNSTISGNGFGAQRIPSLTVSIGKRFAFCAGPVFDKEFRKNTGTYLSTRYFLVRENESFSGHLRLSAVLSFQQMHNEGLSANAIMREKMTALNMKNDESAPFCELRYKGWEATAGAGCSYQFGFGMILRAEAGICYFHTVQQTHCEINSFRDECSSSLRMSVGIGWALHRFTPKEPSFASGKAIQI